MKQNERSRKDSRMYIMRVQRMKKTEFTEKMYRFFTTSTFWSLKSMISFPHVRDLRYSKTEVSFTPSFSVLILHSSMQIIYAIYYRYTSISNIPRLWSCIPVYFLPCLPSYLCACQRNDLEKAVACKVPKSLCRDDINNSWWTFLQSPLALYRLYLHV